MKGKSFCRDSSLLPELPAVKHKSGRRANDSLTLVSLSMCNDFSSSHTFLFIRLFENHEISLKECQKKLWNLARWLWKGYFWVISFLPFTSLILPIEGTSNVDTVCGRESMELSLLKKRHFSQHTVVGISSTCTWDFTHILHIQFFIYYSTKNSILSCGWRELFCSS